MANILNCGDQQLDLSRCNLMGILNVTPDSFSDGGQFDRPDQAMRHVEQMIADGAEIIDVGGESTRPGASPVSVEQELQRVVPVVEAIKKNFDVLVSVDTSTPQVITESAKVGAGLINDVRALQREGALQAAADTGLPVCLMHMQGQPDSMQAAPSYDDVVKDIYQFLDERIKACQQVGIQREQLLLDPGFGFGKTLEHNYSLLNNLEKFHDLKLPLLVGISRKSMIGKVLQERPAQDRLFGSIAAATIAAMKGAAIVRVHDVAATADALKVVEATLQQG